MDFLILVGLLSSHKRPQILLQKPFEYIDDRCLSWEKSNKAIFELFVTNLEALVVHLVDALKGAQHWAALSWLKALCNELLSINEVAYIFLGKLEDKAKVPLIQKLNKLKNQALGLLLELVDL